MKTITKGMILAAGLGTRLRPLTNKTPKPLLPVLGKRMIDFPLQTLADGGIREIIINLHHLGGQIKEYLGSEKFGMKISYSEEPTILGTGGGIKNVGHFFGTDDFAVINCDAIFEIDLNDVIESHLKSKAEATMVIRQLKSDDKYKPVAIDHVGNLLGFNDDGKYFYTGLQILTKQVLDVLPPPNVASCIIRDGYQKLIEQGKRVTTFIHEGKWIDIGDREKYLSVSNEEEKL